MAFALIFGVKLLLSRYDSSARREASARYLEKCRTSRKASCRLDTVPLTLRRNVNAEFSPKNAALVSDSHAGPTVSEGFFREHVTAVRYDVLFELHSGTHAALLRFDHGRS